MANVTLAWTATVAQPRPKLHIGNPWWVLVIRTLAVLSVIALVNLSTVRFVVAGASMQPTFQPDQFLIVSRVHYLLSDPQRGDVAVFQDPKDASVDYIKRVIGLPGDTIELRGQRVYVNGTRLKEGYVVQPCSGDSCSDGIWQLGPDEYFMMGDNRNRSRDSRAFGPIQRDMLIGEVIVRYWPVPEIALIHQIGNSDV